MRGIYVDGDVSFISSDDGGSRFSAETVIPGEGDFVMGGPHATFKAADVVSGTFANANYTRVVLSSEYICFIDQKRFSARIPKAAQIMWKNALEEESRKKIDSAVASYMKYEDEIWDTRVEIEGSESLMASEYHSAIRFIHDSIELNITDTTLRTVLYGRICLYPCFTQSMPRFIECVDPFKMSRKVLEYGIKKKH